MKQSHRSSSKDAGPHSVKTIERAFSILNTFNGGEAGLSVGKVAERAGLHKSTASRLLQALEQLGAVKRDPKTDNYHLGPEIIRLSANIPFVDFLIAVARPFIADLAEATRETVNLCLPDNYKVVHADQVASNYLVGRRDWTGLACPLHCASNGKVLLAYWPEADVERYLSRPLEQITEHTITNADRLREELTAIRNQGYAWGLEELEIGLIGVSAPIFVRGQSPVASVNVSGPAYRFTPDVRPDLTRLTVETAAKISEQLKQSGRA